MGGVQKWGGDDGGEGLIGWVVQPLGLSRTAQFEVMKVAGEYNSVTRTEAKKTIMMLATKRLL